MTLTKQEISRGYDAIAERVGLSPKFYRASVRMAGPLAGRVFDLGCGRGFLLEEIRRRFPNTALFGTDLSGVLVREARTRNPEGRFFQGDAEWLPFRADSCDHVFLTEVLEHLLDYKRGLSEIYRILRPGGTLLVTVPNRDWLRYDAYMARRTPFQPVDDHWFTKTELEGLLISAGFRIERIGGGETLLQRSGFPRLLERVAIALNPALSHRMKRLMIRARKER